MSPFKQRVIEIIQAVPYGKVISYGQVATYVGSPRAARQVGWILHSSEGKLDLPWWRVVNNEGFLSIRGNSSTDKNLQRKLLQAEGIVVGEEYVLDIKKYRFLAEREVLQKMALDEEYVERVITKYL